MDIFVRNLPDQMTENDVNRFFSPILNKVGITTWKCDKLRSKGCAIITVLDVSKAKRFLFLHGQDGKSQQGQLRSRNIRSPIWHLNRIIFCSPSNSDKPVDPFLIRSLEREDMEKKAQALTPRSSAPKVEAKHIPRRFNIANLRCGQWDYQGQDLIFHDYYYLNQPGQISFGKQGLFVTVSTGGSGQSSVPKSHMEINYRSIESYTTGSYDDPSLTFSLREAPRVFREVDSDAASTLQFFPLLLALICVQEISSVDPLLQQMLNLLVKNDKASPIRRKRVTSLDQAHGNVIGACLCYRFKLQDPQDIRIVQTLKTFHEIPGSFSFATSCVIGPSFTGQMSVLNHTLAVYESVPFDLKFQLQRLAQNGSLPPYKVSELMVAIQKLMTPQNSKTYVDAVFQLFGQIPFPGPNVEASAFSLSTLIEQVIQNRDRVGQSWRDNWEQFDHLILVHKANVTPAGIYLEGPQPEVKNRVLRKYAMFPNHFLSVSFSEEDGEIMRHDRQTSSEDIFQVRFRQVLEKIINIAGRGYEFLGFSHSSLRAHTCWFMAPFTNNGTLTYARAVIRDLGDFSTIRSPAKCAARIGQAFSQTLSSIRIPPEAIQEMPDIERNGRTFSDGVGVCSKEILQMIWDQYGTARGLKPTIIQVRLQGAKGVLSLDTSLRSLAVRLRPSMIKFEGTKVSDIEICGSASRPLPMMLNRQVIKILEDLGVKEHAFLNLQNIAIDELRATTRSAANAAKFLTRHSIGVAAKLSWLIRKIWEMGLHFSDDFFLQSTLELAVLAQLRELKYRARIPVKLGVTLYGIMDETGILEEGEIYCSSDKNVIVGKVTITRSPALHPGDVRVVSAVNVPQDSPLCQLHNVIVFSQKGERDLPSMLSGGDLDGDLYNVIYDPDIYPKKMYPPADYTAPKPIDIGRPVEASDMTNHFLSFMENDALGRIATLHQIIADQSEFGVLDAVCLQLAGLHSDAVDFSKTGIPVPFRAIPKYPNARPDFLANGPRIVIEKQSINLEDIYDIPLGNPFAELDEAESYAPPKVRYYESRKVLGKLYRNVDEFKFLEQLQLQAKSASADQDIIGKVWNYVRGQCISVQWEHQEEAAKDIKESYEDNLADTMISYCTTPNECLSEAEVFSGSILGKYGGASKQQRENAAEMKTKFDRDTAYTTACIKNGLDGSSEESLARSIACLFVSLTTKSTRRRVGVLHSFQWIAASTCLKEVEDMLSSKVS